MGGLLGVEGCRERNANLSPPHPEEPAEALAKAGVSKDGAATGFERDCFAMLLTMRPGEIVLA
jgi:hypothetical protein